MPYIKPEKRQELDPHVEKLVKELSYRGFDEGELNYVITCIFVAAFRAARRYATINKLRGVLGCVWSEFYRRHAAPYEDEKIKENGDVA